METKQVTYLSIYREKVAIRCLYDAYLKAFYSNAQYELFKQALVTWYDEDAVIDDEVLQEAMSAFRYGMKVYL